MFTNARDGSRLLLRVMTFRSGGVDTLQVGPATESEPRLVLDPKDAKVLALALLAGCERIDDGRYGEVTTADLLPLVRLAEKFSTKGPTQ